MGILRKVLFFKLHLERLVSTLYTDGANHVIILLDVWEKNAYLMWLVRHMLLMGACPLAGIGMVTPVNDLFGMESPSFAKGERQSRCGLAGLYRLVDLFSWARFTTSYNTVSTTSRRSIARLPHNVRGTICGPHVFWLLGDLKQYLLSFRANILLMVWESQICEYVQLPKSPNPNSNM